MRILMADRSSQFIHIQTSMYIIDLLIAPGESVDNPNLGSMM